MSADKFGFYSVGDFKTYSKVEAIELSKSLNLDSHWNFNDEVFKSINWKIDPPVDLWTLYKARAKQIREQYDYVVLWYSGGSDSHNILNAWIDADCKIDEIATVWNYDASADKQDHANAEITNVVLPDIQLLKDRGFDFKFRLVDISQMSLDVFDYFKNNYEYYINRYFSINNPARALLREKIQDYKDIIDSGKKLCFVWGVEKPRLRLDEYGYYFNFIDAIDNCVSPYVQERYHQGWYDELFYWTPDYPIIPIKQAHVLKQFVTVCHDPIYYEDIKNDNGYNKTLNKYLKIETVKTLIYPKWNNSIFCNGKAASFIFSERDNWFLNSNLDLRNKYKNIVMRTMKILGSEHGFKGGWIQNKNISPHSTTNYYLE